MDLFERLSIKGDINSTQFSRSSTTSEQKLRTQVPSGFTSPFCPAFRRPEQVTEPLCCSFLKSGPDHSTCLIGSDGLIHIKSLDQGLTPGKLTICVSN